MDWMCRRWAGGNVDVANPFFCQQRPAMLYMKDSMFHSHMSKQLDIHVWWCTMSFRSRSLFVTWPSGLPQDTSCAIMSAVKCARHIMGCAPTGSGDVDAALGCG